MRRRNLLKGAGASLGAATVASGVASAEGEEHDVADRLDVLDAYGDVEAFRRTVAVQAAPVLEQLSDRDVIDAPSIDEFPVERLDETRTRLEPGADDGAGVTAVETPEGDRHSLLMVATNTETHNVRLFAKPEVGESYALVSTHDGDERYAVDAEQGYMTASNRCEHQDDYICGSDCGQAVDPIACLLGACVDKSTTIYLEWYRCGSIGDRYDCCSKTTGTTCGAETCFDA